MEQGSRSRSEILLKLTKCGKVRLLHGFLRSVSSSCCIMHVIDDAYMLWLTQRSVLGQMAHYLFISVLDRTIRF